MKLGIIGGAGLIGATVAFCAASEGLFDEIRLFDVRENLAMSHAMDIEQAVCERNAVKLSVCDIDGLRACDIILNAAGIPEMKAGSRDDYLSGNILIIRELAQKIKKWDTAPIILSATNPIDVLNFELYRASGLPREKVIGFSRNDSLRFVWATSKETEIPVSDLNALVIGEHGDAQVPLFSSLKHKSSGQIVELRDEQKNDILQRVKVWFSEYQTLDSGRSSGWTSAQGITHILKLILTNSNDWCPCSVIPNGEYGLHDLSIGLPVRLGLSGVREIAAIKLSEDEETALQNAAKKIRLLIPTS